MYRASGQPPPVRDFAPENLKAWNIISNYPALPEREAIRAIHVYDFDNTLFLSPLPNTKVWHSPTLNNLQSPNWLANGGWWHDPRVLAATGDGLEVEEKRAWEGWWNEHIVALVKLSMEQKDALTVLLTGRSIKGFAPLIQRIVKSKGLEFDLVVLKPDILPDGKKAEHTIAFKCAFLEELLNTYSLAQELRIYEDRAKHVRNFEDFTQQYIVTANTFNRRASLAAEVIQVAEVTRTLEPSVELAQVQKMMNEHNQMQRTVQGRSFSPLKMKKTVFLTGYMLNSAATAHVLNELETPALALKEQDVRLLANNVLITPRPATKSVLDKTGPLGRRVEFEIIKVGNLENRIWAALVKPTDPTTHNSQPLIILALRRGSRPVEACRIDTWGPPPKEGIKFNTVIGEKLLLRIEEENPNEGFRHPHHNQSHPRGHDGRTRGAHSDGFRGRGSGYRGRGGGRGGRGGGRGGAFAGRDDFRDYTPIGRVEDMQWMDDAY